MIGLFKRDHKIYTEIVPEGNRGALLEVIRGRTNLSSITLPCNGQHYDAVVEMRQGRFMRIDHRHRPMVQGRIQQPIDELENFWSFAKGHLAKFRGVSAGVLHLHLKECEFRFNHRNQDLAPIVLEILLKEPLF
jgi:transposase-like protein